MSEVSVAELEHQLSETKKLVERAERIKKLFNNRDFRDLVLEQFCKVDAARYVHESADPSLDEAQRADALAIAQAGGHFKRYFAIQLRMADVAERNVRELEEAIAEARADEVEA